MTTQAAANLYLAQHEHAMQDKGYAIYNPNGLPTHELPIIFGYNAGGSPGWYDGVLLAQDGTYLGGHSCSHEGYMPHDLGILEGTRPDRHEGFRAHYPNGYRMDFVPYDDVLSHKLLGDAYALNQLARQAAEQNNED